MKASESKRMKMTHDVGAIIREKFNSNLYSTLTSGMVVGLITLITNILKQFELTKWSDMNMNLNVVTAKME